MLCDPSGGGSCSQPDGTDSCKVENASTCMVGKGAGCSKVVNNSGKAILIPGRDGVPDFDSFNAFIPRGVTVSTCSCVGGMKDWVVGSARCSALLPDMTHGQTPVTLTDSTGPDTGSATFSCNGATVSAPSSPSCVTAPTPPTRCPATTLRWNQGANSCEMNVLDSDDGTPIAASDTTGPATGTAQFTCNGTSWSAPSSPSCVVPASGCSANQHVMWCAASGAYCCNGDTTVAGVPGNRTSVTAPRNGVENHGGVMLECRGSSWEVLVGSEICDCNRIGNNPANDCE